MDKKTESFDFNSLKDLTEHWEDYEEPKEYWYICTTRNYEITRVIIDDGTDFDRLQKDKEIGNYFVTLEEAEQAVEKLKAWKRLKDLGFRFNGFKDGLIGWTFNGKEVSMKEGLDCWEDFKFIFAGQNELKI